MSYPTYTIQFVYTGNPSIHECTRKGIDAALNFVKVNYLIENCSLWRIVDENGTIDREWNSDHGIVIVNGKRISPVSAQDSDDDEDSNPDTIEIEGETYHVSKVSEYGYGTDIETDEGEEFKVFQDRETAARAARNYWADMADRDPGEFACIVGEQTLIAWALGRAAGPGSTLVKSLDEWLDLCAEHPEEEFASYDHEERDVEALSESALQTIGFRPEVAYRTN